MITVVIKIKWMLLLLLFSIPIASQVEYGGKPLRNNADFDPARVLYLLEKEDPIYLEGLKSEMRTSFAKPLTYAIERPVDLSPDFNGQWVEAEGMSIWRVHLVSPEAYSLGLIFSEFKLNEGVKLFVYSPDGSSVKGAFTEKNNKSYGSFYVGHIPGEELIVEMQVPGKSWDYGLLRIGSVSHAFLPVYAKSSPDPGLGESQDCEVDVNCKEGEDWQILKRSVVHINTSTQLCTGVLVNNTLYNGKPYILTAEHCINQEFYAEKSVFYFGYENSECGGNDATMDKSVSGSTLLATGDSLDFSIIQLTTRPPRDYNVYYAGWDTRDISHDAPVALHHPYADAMKISFEYSKALVAEYVTGDINDYIVESNFHIRQWDIGTTEAGSSGCPLYSREKKVIGLLSGGRARCGDSIGYDEVKKRAIFSLDENVDDFFTRLSYDWDYYSESNKQLKTWLDPSGRGQTVIGGLSSMTLDFAEEKFDSRQLYIFPNPANNVINVQLPQYSFKELTASAYDVSGREFELDVVPYSYPVTLSVAGLNPGMYILHISDGLHSYRGNLLIVR